MSAQNAPSFRLRDLPRVPDKTLKYFLLRLEALFDKVAETIGARPIMWGLLIVLFHYLVAGTFFAFMEGRTPPIPSTGPIPHSRPSAMGTFTPITH